MHIAKGQTIFHVEFACKRKIMFWVFFFFSPIRVQKQDQTNSEMLGQREDIELKGRTGYTVA